MADGPRYSVKFRRRREGKTNYRTRLALLKSRMTRAVVRKTLTNVIVQFVEFTPEGDKILAAAEGKELKKFGFEGSAKCSSSAYLTGLLAAKRAAKKEVSEAVLDVGLQATRKGSRVFAALKGMIDGGIEIPHGEDVLPDQARIEGKHLKEKATASFKTAKSKIEALK